MYPPDRNVPTLESMQSMEELRASFKGQSVCVVGGTRGIGSAIAQTLKAAGARVLVVGRSADASSAEGVAADLFTVSGCLKAVEDIEAKLSSWESSGTPIAGFCFMVFTVGMWPCSSEPYTADGVDKVIALDLVARHILTTRMYKKGLLASGCRVMNVLASGQKFPGFDAQSIRARLEAGVAIATEVERIDHHSISSAAAILFAVAIAHDAWLQHVAKLLPSICFTSTFPGVLVTDLPKASLPSWLIPVLNVAMTPVADSYEEMGLRHATILASQHRFHHSDDNWEEPTVRYWAVPLLQAREGHPLVYDTELARWVYDFAERIVQNHSP